jgi:hypothetical protein
MATEQGRIDLRNPTNTRAKQTKAASRRGKLGGRPKKTQSVISGNPAESE